ncbi:unnamed protein product [Diamesa tonsa]
MQTTTTIKTLKTFDTVYSSDSVEWCPSEGYQNYFVVGTYQLQENEKDSEATSSTIRKGKIYLFCYEQATDELILCDTIETDAILDQKWIGDYLITTTSVGTVQVYKLNEKQLKLQNEFNLAEGETDNLALSVDVDAQKRTLISDSKGRITLAKIDGTIERQWLAHDYEAWTCSFDFWNENVVYSGGDDSKLITWDLRCDLENPSKLKTSQRDSGITSIHSYSENTIMCGSYDEKLCVYDTRSMKIPIQELNLNGGVWRIKPSKINSNIFLVACMYKNFSIVEYGNDLNLIGEYNEHSSICYGCDWSKEVSNDWQFFAACSFYDHKLSLCKVKIDSV